MDTKVTQRAGGCIGLQFGKVAFVDGKLPAELLIEVWFAE